MKRPIKIVILIVIVLAAAGVVYAFVSKPKTPEYIIGKAEITDLVQTVDATGSVSSPQNIGLNFKAQGLISALRVAIGDKVKKDQILAELSAGNVRSQVDNARASVIAAQADLQKLLSGSTSEQVAVTQAEVSNAEITLASYKTALANLELTQAKTRDDYQATALQTLDDKLFVAKYSLQVIYDAILNPQGQTEFKTADAQALEKSSSSYNRAKNYIATTEQLILIARQTKTNTDILAALSSLQQALDETSSSLDGTFKALSAAVANTVFPAATIETLKTSMNTQATAVATAKTSVNTSIDNLTTGDEDLRKTYDAAVYAVKTAEGTLQLAKAKLQLTMAKPQPYEIQQQQAKVAQAQASLSAAESNYADTIIRAPLDGTITAVDAKVGEQALAGTPIISMIGNDKLEIDVDIPESDISKISLNDPAEITLDAFGSDVAFQGLVTFIEPAERLIQGVVHYRVKINFNDESAAIKPGMTANITIKTDERTKVLAIPIRGINTSLQGEKKVRVLKKGVAEERIVTTGLRGDNGFIEIMSGINEDDTIVLGENK